MEQAPLTIEQLLANHGYALLNLPTGGNYQLAQKSDGTFVQVWRFRKDQELDLINMTDWHQGLAEEHLAGYVVPPILETIRASEFNFVIATHPEQTTFLEHVRKGLMNNDLLDLWVDFIWEVENMPSFAAENGFQSKYKKRVDYNMGWQRIARPFVIAAGRGKYDRLDWTRDFKQNAISFYHRILTAIDFTPSNRRLPEVGVAQIRIKDVINGLLNICDDFQARANGQGGLHGRPLLGNKGILIAPPHEMTVTGFEVATPWYLKYYHLASEVCNLLARNHRYNGKAIAIQLLQKFQQRLDPISQTHFNQYFSTIFAQRMLGELGDIGSTPVVESEIEARVVYVKDVVNDVADIFKQGYIGPRKRLAFLDSGLTSETSEA